MGKLLVRILSARNLAKKDSFPQPYCSIHCGNETFKTQSIFNTTNPVWKETAQFNNASPYTDVRLVVYNRHMLSKDRAIGSVIVSLAHVPWQQPVNMFLLLHPQGELNVEFVAEDFGVPTRQTSVGVMQQAGTASKQQQVQHVPQVPMMMSNVPSTSSQFGLPPPTAPDYTSVPPMTMDASPNAAVGYPNLNYYYPTRPPQM